MAVPRTRSFLLGVTILITAAGALAACGGGDDEGTSAATSSAADTGSASSSASGSGAAATGTLTAEDQNSDGTTVVVASVTLEGAPDGGWIALHEDDNGKPGPVHYFAQIPEGTSTNVEITADEPIASGAYWPMLHLDDGTIGTYEFGEVEGADPPVVVNGTPVMQQIQVTVG
ncbi:DUF7282 domain-containing protein [Geodermatophilus sp. URMC 64]